MVAETDITTEKIIFAALLKAMSEQSEYLRKELKFEMKQDFNNLIRRADEIIAKIECNVNPDQKELFAYFADKYHAVGNDLRKQLKTVQNT